MLEFFKAPIKYFEFIKTPTIGITALTLFVSILPSGCSSGSSSSGNSSAPTISAISPSSIGLYGGAITLAGTQFDETSTVLVGGTDCPTTTTPTTTTIKCTAPAHKEGSPSILVTNARGANVSDSNTGLAYKVAPILGQASATTSTAAQSDSGMSSPYAISADLTNRRLAVADRSNNRVLLWNSIPTSIGQAADLVLGQTTMTGSTANSGGIGAGTLSGPRGVYIGNGKIIVADTGNNRVLIWSSWPTANGQSADLVLGQSSFTVSTDSSASPTAQTCTSPWGIAVGSSQELYVSCNGDKRVLYFSSIPTVSTTSATFSIGQATLTTAGVSATTQAGMSDPQGISSGSGYVAVADKTNNRVLIYATPGASGSNASLVLGQSSFTASTSGCTQAGMSSPNAVSIQGKAIVVSDSSNNRVLYWSDFTKAVNGQAPDKVFGQTDYTTCTAGTTQTTIKTPSGLYLDSIGYLWLTEDGNNRLSINSWL